MSFFKRQDELPRNRRRAQPKPKSSGSSRSRKILQRLGRWGRRAAELCVLAAALAGLAVLGNWIHTYVRTSSYFAADIAAIHGNQRVPPGVIQHMSGLTPGTNIFAVSPSEAARRITEHPWIASAQVSRRLPSQIMIEVVEREAVAILRLGGLYLVDTEGNVFDQLGPGDPVDLPVITGVNYDHYREDRPGTRADLVEALALIRLYEESGLSTRYPLSEVHFEQDGSLSIYTVEEATHIRLGRPPFRRKLRRLARLFRELRSRHAVADYVYLEEGDDHQQPDRAVVRLRAN